MVDTGTVVAAIATGLIFILIGLIFFVVGALADAFRGSRRPKAAAEAGPRCIRCGSLMTPLLDGSHRFVGEAVCRRGHLVTDVRWPTPVPAA
jgi:hypothetical protein